MYKSIKLLAAISTAVMSAPIAAADDFRISAGGEYIVDSDDTDFALTGVTGRASYFFNNNVGFEAEGTVGVEKLNDYGPNSIDYELGHQYGAYVVGKMNVGRSGELFGRAGFRSGKIVGNGTIQIGNSVGFLSQEFEQDGIAVGAGYTHFFNENIGLRADVTTSFTTLDNAGLDLTSAALSLVYKFDVND